MTDEPRALARLREAFPDALLSTSVHRGEATATVRRETIRDILRFLRNDAELAFGFLSDLTGVDYLDLNRSPRFAVVYHLYSLKTHDWLRLKVPVEEDDPVVPSITDEWPTANWHERETFDMFGIQFAGHPDLTRILMPDDWVGHPLRKDSPLLKEDIEFTYNADRLRQGLHENVQ